MKHAGPRTLCATLLGLGLAAAGLPTRADPMRPLAAASPPAPARAASAADAPGATIVAVGRLSATRRASNGRWEGLVDRRWLQAGARLDGAVVQAVTANDLVLLRNGRSDTLHLLPVLIPPAAPPAVAISPDSPSPPATRRTPPAVPALARSS